ncbi:MAG: T9SS type B sorting domain-containing protein [Polaribacter sp.]
MSKKHFIPPLTYAETGNANPEEQYFYISTPSNKTVNFTIKQVGSPSGDIVGTVSKDTPRELIIHNSNSQLLVDSNTTSIIFNDKGYIIEADSQIYVSIRIIAGGRAQAGALVSKGNAALGTIFRAGMFTNGNPQTNYLNFISVMATENNTKLNFSGLPAGIALKNYSGAFPIPEITLNEGESYVLATNAAENIVNQDGLIGTLIASDKNVVVNVGSANGSFGTGGGRDYGLDQIVDLSKVGKEYIFVRGSGNDSWENALIVAHENNTEIFVNDETAAITTINAGEYFVIEGNKYTGNGNMYLRTSKDVFAYQGIGGLGNNGSPSEANQGMFFVPPLSCENRGKVDNIPLIDEIGDTVFTGGITIVTNSGATVTVNKQPISNFNTSGPFNVPGNANYVTYKVLGLSSNISIESSGELYCAYFNQNGAATSGSFYSGFPTAPEINFDATVSTLGNCIPNVTLEAANTDLFDSLEWFYDDELGGGFVSTGSTNAKYTPLQPGRYQLRATISCTMTTFKSVEVPVSICPDDYDKDLIIDNIDDDIDNDGILNCDESLGNANLDISNLNTPSVVLNDGTIKNIITTATLMQSDVSNTFIGSNNGNFVSTLINDVSAVNEYKLGFSQNINFSLKQTNTGTHEAKNDEYFIIKTTPNNKNITLLNPDNQLLIDSNNDDEFESGITQISASEIKFKYNANLSGAASTFEFVANQVNGIKFFHFASNTDASTFRGNFTITCFTRDSDNDGVEDMFDLDSDNDGIPDLNETGNDTDSDLVPNYLDIDSDNDGIYDSTESGHNFDANFNGIIDAFIDTNSNGISDNIENDTSLQTLSINYTIADTDADAIFNFLELDADNDACFDVIEAGFTGNGSGILQATPFDTETNGKVKNNADGYTNPNTNYTTAGIITVTNFVDFTFCELDTDTMTINSTADTYQWQLFDGTNWVDILNDTQYSGVASKDLTITNTPTSLNNTKYRVQLEKIGNSCGSVSNEITLTVNPKPLILNAVVQLNQCADNPSEITTVNLTEAEISISIDTTVKFEYYETEQKAIDGGVPNQVSDKEMYPVNRTASAWVRTVSDKDCYTISRINITASFAGDVAYDKTFEECDDFLDADGNNTISNSDVDGISFFDFSIAEQEVINNFPVAIRGDIEVFFYETTADRNAAINAIKDISKHRNNNDVGYAFNQTIYIKIKNKNNNDCEGIGKLFLKTNAIPEFSVDGEAPNDPIIICAKNIPFTLMANNPADTYDYIWQDENGNPLGGNQPTLPVSDAGKYTVTAFSRDTKICSRARTIVVQKSNFETLNDSFVTIKDDTSGTNSNLSIQIDIPTNPLINEEFQYALENEQGVTIRSFQDSNVFNDIEGGVYKIIVENKNGCGSSELLVSVIQFPKFFTPNGDTNNDTWTIKGATKTFYQTSKISIFNRFGKLITDVDIDGRGWDGTYKGKKLPADDYWYSIQLIPIDPTKITINKKGNFSLID